MFTPKTTSFLLHQAIRETRSVTVLKFLLSSGVSINQRDGEGNTPLHIAVMQQSLEHIKWLIENGADVKIKNTQQQQTAYELAKQLQVSAIVDYLKSREEFSSNTEIITEIKTIETQEIKKPSNHTQVKKDKIRNADYLTEFKQLLNIGKKLLSEKNFKVAQETFVEAYQLTEKQHNDLGQVDCLKQLANLYLMQKDYASAAKLANSALAVFDHTDPQKLKDTQNSSNSITRDSLIQLCQRTETIFIHERLQKIPSEGKKINYEEPRVYLKAFRDVVAKQVMSANHPSQDILRYITKLMVELTHQFIEEAIVIIGKPPCDYTFISMGSISREEMSPYSDLEFAILIKKDNEQNRNYFKKITEFLEIKIINLGETSCKIENLFICPTWPKAGFCFDSGGNTPLNHSTSLISTPEQLAQLQQPDYYDNAKDNLVAANALKCVGYICGTQNLLKDYEKQTQIILNGRPKIKHSKVNKVREQQALQMLERELRWYEPELNQKKEQQAFFNIKEELYRLPNSILADLAVFYGLESKNTWDRLAELQKKDLIRPEACKNLGRAMAEITRLRIRTHLHYQTEKEDIYHKNLLHDPHPHLDPNMIQNLYAIEEQDIQTLFEIYQVLLPLHKATKTFCDSQGKDNSFGMTAFYDNSLVAQGEAYNRLGQYEKAQSCYQQAIAIHPDDAEALNRLGLIYEKLGNSKQALTYYERALKIKLELHGEDHPEVANTLNNIGLIWGELNEHRKAIEFYERARIINVKHCGETSAQAATIFNNLGLAWSYLDDKQKAIGFYNQALTINEAIYGNVHETVATNLNNLGTVWSRVGDKSKALACYQRASTINEAIYGKDHPNLTTILHNLGKTFQKLGNVKGAITYFERARTIKEKNYGNNHPKLALTLNDLGLAWQELGEQQKAIKLLERAFNLAKSAYGKDHPSVITYNKDLTAARQELTSSRDTKVSSLHSNMKVTSTSIFDEDNERSREFGSIPPSRKVISSSVIFTDDKTVSGLDYGGVPYDGLSNKEYGALPSGETSLSLRGYAKLQNALAADPKITFIDLSNCNIYPEELRMIAGVLENNTTLTTMRLNWNNIGTEGAKILAVFLERNAVLTALDLRKNNLDAAAANILASALEKNMALREINLQDNNLAIGGAKTLAFVLKKNVTLTAIGLKSNNIGAEGAKVLAEALEENNTLMMIDLERNLIGNEGAKALARTLEKNIALRKINLNDNKLGEEGITALANALQKNSTLTLIDLKKNELGEEGAKALVEALEKNANLTISFESYSELRKEPAKTAISLWHKDEGNIYMIAEMLKRTTALASLSIEGFGVNARIARALAKALKSNTSLTTMVLDNCWIYTEAEQAVAEALKINTSLKTINLRYNNISGVAIGKALKSNATLTTVNLSHNKVDVLGGQAIAEALKNNTTLTTIDLPANELGAPGGQAIAEALKHNTTLMAIDLRANQLSDIGGMSIADALKSNSTLKSLNLSNNQLGTESGRVIAEAVMNNTTLTSIDLHGNCLGAAGVKAIAEALKYNTTLTTIDLSGNQLNDASGISIAFILKNNAGLRAMSLQYNQLGAESGKFIADGLMNNTTLTSIDLHGNRMGVAGVKVIAEALKYNTSLESIYLGFNELNTADGKIIAEILKYNTTLTTIHLTDNFNMGAEIRNFIEHKITKDNCQLRNQFHQAVQTGDLIFVQQNIHKISLLSTTGDQNNTALHWAAYNGHLEIVQLLLEKMVSKKMDIKVNILAKNKNDLTPLALAQQNSHANIVALIETYSPKQSVKTLASIPEFSSTLTKVGNNNLQNNRGSLAVLVNQSIASVFPSMIQSSSESNFYHTSLNRIEAEALLKKEKSGAFLFRPSSVPNSIALSCLDITNQITHCLVTLESDKSITVDGKNYLTLRDFLVKHQDIFIVPVATEVNSLSITSVTSNKTTSLSNSLRSNISNTKNNTFELITLINQSLLSLLPHIHVQTAFSKSNFYHADLNRTEAESLLKTQKPSTFLFRPSSVKNSIALSRLDNNNQVIHSLLTLEINQSFTVDGKNYPTLRDFLIKHQDVLTVPLPTEVDPSSMATINSTNIPATIQNSAISTQTNTPTSSVHSSSSGFWKNTQPPTVQITNQSSTIDNTLEENTELQQAIEASLEDQQEQEYKIPGNSK